MADLVQSQPQLRSGPLALASVLSAGALTLLFAHALAAYWSFYHLGSGGTGLFLMLIVLPGGLALSINVVFFVARALIRRGKSLGRGVVLGSLAAALVFAGLLSLEIARTTALRSGEGSGAGDLAPYLLHHVR